VGIFFFILGIILGVARFRYGFKPDMLDMKIFAFSSSYLETKYMEFVRNNMSEEFTGFFLVAGLFLIAFSREKIENEMKNRLRLKAFFIAAYLNFLFLLVSLFFTYGFAFIYMSIANMGISMLAYILVFQVLLRQKNQLETDI
jgi:drug/metabolite transporter (DMT)-like permease